MSIDIETLAAATGSGYSKITTIAVAGVLYVVCPVSDRTARVKWFVKADKAHEVQLYTAETNPLSATITLTDATAVDDGDNFVLNGETYAGESTEGDASAAARKFYLGANNAAAAVNLTALLNDASYGVPGFSFAVAAVDATDVITATPTTGTCLQFGQGTSAANEIAWSDGTLARMTRDGAAMTGLAADTTTLGYTIEQFNDGLVPILGLTNKDGAAALTAVIRASRFAA